MTLMTDSAFAEFFKPYAGNVEGFYEATYWKLSDELIKELVRRHLGLAEGDHVVDAGGGTGRWALWCASEFNVEVTIADKSEAMLDEARRNIESAGMSDRVHTRFCDLHEAPELGNAEFDAVISTYGVLSFLDEPASVFNTLFRSVKPGGQALLMSHSLSNALVSKINRDHAGAEELLALSRDQIVKWAPHVPPLRVYSAADLRALAENAGFDAVGVYGVTSMVHPGQEDFGYPYDEISAVSRALEDEAYFQTALELELAATERSEWAERGVNLMVHASKPGARR